MWLWKIWINFLESKYLKKLVNNNKIIEKFYLFILCSSNSKVKGVKSFFPIPAYSAF